MRTRICLFPLPALSRRGWKIPALCGEHSAMIWALTSKLPVSVMSLDGHMAGWSQTGFHHTNGLYHTWTKSFHLTLTSIRYAQPHNCDRVALISHVAGAQESITGPWVLVFLNSSHIHCLWQIYWFSITWYPDVIPDQTMPTLYGCSRSFTWPCQGGCLRGPVRTLSLVGEYSPVVGQFHGDWMMRRILQFTAICLQLIVCVLYIQKSTLVSLIHVPTKHYNYRMHKKQSCPQVA